MKFPITRECLQTFDYHKVQEDIQKEELEKRINHMLGQLCENFNKNMRINCIKKRFVWNILSSFRNVNVELPVFIEKLKELFIGCDITIDHSNTYVIIDWN